MKQDSLIHNYIVQTLKDRLSKEYREIKDNTGEKRHEINGVFPDLILGNHGLVLAACEVETEESITPEKADDWKKIIESGTRLFLMVPATKTKDVTSLLWEKGLADKASLGTYEIRIRMP